VLIDPAVQVARDVLHCLARQGRLAVEALPAGMPRGEFYVSVPDRQHPAVRLDAQGGFTHEYKYGRGPRYDGCDVLRVPLVPASLDPESRQRLKSQIPRTWALLEEFGQSIDRASGR
jgi:hypothetical protein